MAGNSVQKAKILELEAEENRLGLMVRVTDLAAGVISGDVIFKNRSGDREL